MLDFQTTKSHDEFSEEEALSNYVWVMSKDSVLVRVDFYDVET